MKLNFGLLIAALALLLSACTGGSTGGGRGVAGDGMIAEARLLHIERCEGYTLATMGDPWQGGVLHRYVLVPAADTLPAQLPQGTVVRTPLHRALVYSSVHTSVMKELGMFASVRGVCDTRFFTDSAVLAGVARGEIADCGDSMSPTVERVIAMQPDGILLSPYQDATYGQVTKLDIPIIECADYMESTPLGRAEWIKFYGLLLGKEREADSIYAEVVASYTAIRDSAAQATRKPMVLTEMVLNGVWNVPGGQSYMARILQDAGGSYPWADDRSTGSLNLDFNQVLARAQQADVWLIKSFYVHSYSDLKGAYALNDQFRAFQQRKVYVCDTNESRLFEQFPFHPDRLLRDYFIIFHPELQPAGAATRYFSPLP
ncbi:MAG: ABC transporter substrate-binding protein [Muribaculaceae bacterium]|nr:ABC transporter substrate-binding protein [Muribaculaceae bacterium]